MYVHIQASHLRIEARDHQKNFACRVGDTKYMLWETFQNEIEKMKKYKVKFNSDALINAGV